ncbi:MAG TPA: phosphatidylserine decarboxylase [Alphaproteobacteria bacterium]|nr:phosphatidylserine decarboxylase [Alphaproteobacteria bacterium]
MRDPATTGARALPTSFVIRIHREGWPFILAFAAATALLFWLSVPLGWLGLVLSIWCAYFFRDPDRVTPVRAGLVISPADGVVLPVVEESPPAELELESQSLTRVSIFMNIFDVHVNRAPCDGRLVRRSYRPGRFVNASLDKASEDNERMALRFSVDGDGQSTELTVVQIAGLIARRIVCHVDEGARVRAGERIGIIRFGSRVDVYLPSGIAPLVSAGQRVVGGETVIADLHSREPQRAGEVR